MIWSIPPADLNAALIQRYLEKRASGRSLRQQVQHQILRENGLSRDTPKHNSYQGAIGPGHRSSYKKGGTDACTRVKSVCKMSLVRFLYTTRYSLQKKVKTGSLLGHV